MKMKSARKLASRYLNVGRSKVKIDAGKAKEIKEAITGEDIKGLITNGSFTKSKEAGQSRGRARVLLLKKQKGRKRGPGKKRGTLKTRIDSKRLWLIKVRSQRDFIKKLYEEKTIDKESYRDLYGKVKGGFFRNKAHINTYITKK